MLDHLLENVLLIYLLEIGAAVSGTLYMRNVKDRPPGSGLVVFYFWLVVFFEGVGLYPVYAYYSDYTKLGFVEGTLIERNFWWYNIYNIIKIIFLSYFFILQFVSVQKQNIFFVLTWILTLTFIFDLFYSGSFFTQYPLYTSVSGSLYLIVLILVYYKEMLEGYRILNFNSSIAFYISTGMLVWHTMVTPLTIYSKYFSRTSPEFVALTLTILQWANVILYGIIILGFWVCLKKGKRNHIKKKERG